MAVGRMTRRWLVVIVVTILVVLVAVWLYTAYAAEEVEPEVGDGPRVSAIAPPAPALPPPTLHPGR